jgi:hypothetical protein
MKNVQRLGRVLLVGLAALTTVQGSDFTGVYARVDKVVLEPGSEAPERVQVWGVFSLAKASDRTSYEAPARGYLYFKLDRNPQAARAEWNDLKQLAGTKQIVAFGVRGPQPPRLRKSDEKAENPDAYATNIGVNKVNGKADYEPVKALLAYKD